MKERTNNKVFFCWGCAMPLTGDKTMFCEESCAATYGQRQSKRDLGKVKVWAYLNKSMLDLAIGERAEPHEFSGFFHTGNDLMGVALFDRDQIEAITQAEQSASDAYWREIPENSQDIIMRNDLMDHDENALRAHGLQSYVFERTGSFNEITIAKAIADIVVLEKLKDPIELFNTL
jgi:hypothetical protein